jgi:hypothetical protein
MSQQFGGGFHWPTVINNYHFIDFNPQPLGLMDTESDFTIDNAFGFFTLPGLPYDPKMTPATRLLKVVSVTSPTPGSFFQIGPIDSGAQFPALADFRQIQLQSVNDEALIMWNGKLWQLVSLSGPSANVIPIDQFNVTTA